MEHFQFLSEAKLLTTAAAAWLFVQVVDFVDVAGDLTATAAQAGGVNIVVSAALVIAIIGAALKMGSLINEVQNLRREVNRIQDKSSHD